METQQQKEGCQNEFHHQVDAGRFAPRLLRQQCQTLCTPVQARGKLTQPHGYCDANV